MATNILGCTACLRRAVPASPLGQAFTEASALLHSNPHRATRPYATEAAASAAPSDAPQSLDVEPLDASIVQKKKKERLERIVKKELVHLDDTWKLAQQVERKLSQNRYDEALLLTQKASKGKQVVVSWNHLINYQLENQQLKTAMKLYNDMKKRAQLPTVHTFSVIFRGLSKSQHPKLAVAEALKQYNLLLSDTRLQPNSIHLNAVLNVCAKAGDLDSMFLVADSANDSTRAPTAWTYTTILNALRHHGLKDMHELTEEQQQAVVAKVINQAKGLWMEVMDKWRAGRLIIDEELVCAMGRMLLLEPKREQRRQVFDLLEQTMSIPNLLKEPDSSPLPDPNMKNIAVAGKSKRVGTTKSVYAVPSRNTLALMLTVLASSKATKVGIKYWNLMVRHYGIVPDADNWLRMFGMLKVAKSSAHASIIIDYLPSEYKDPKPFRIAMETCVRDNFNHNVMKNAVKILDASVERLDTPDLHTLRLFLRTALVSHHQMRAKTDAGDLAGGKYDYGVQITEALARLWEPYKKMHYHYFKATKPRTKTDERVLYNDKREVIALARLMISAFNKVINENMLPEKDLVQLRPVGAKINREIQAFFANRDEHEPKIRRGRATVLEAKAETLKDNSESSPAVERRDESSLWGADYRSVGEYIWNTDGQTRNEEEEKRKYEERVKRREEREAGKVYERVVKKMDSRFSKGREQRAW